MEGIHMSKPISLEYGNYYHIYNRGNNRENIFIEKRNYRYFLNLYAKYIEPVTNTYAYCLLPNHFHFLVRIKAISEQEEDKNAISFKASQQFSNLFNAYTKAINRSYQRTGSLFQRPFARIQITSQKYFNRLVIYIHQNPQKHSLVEDFRNWPYSSYHALLSRKPTRLQRNDVLTWFGSAKNIETSHQKKIAQYQVAELVPEDFD